MARAGRARIRFRLYVAGRRVNVLLALLPSALHIAPAAQLREFCRYGFARGGLFTATKNWERHFARTPQRIIFRREPGKGKFAVRFEKQVQFLSRASVVETGHEDQPATPVPEKKAHNPKRDAAPIPTWPANAG